MNEIASISDEVEVNRSILLDDLVKPIHRNNVFTAGTRNTIYPPGEEDRVQLHLSKKHTKELYDYEISTGFNEEKLKKIFAEGKLFGLPCEYNAKETKTMAKLLN